MKKIAKSLFFMSVVLYLVFFFIACSSGNKDDVPIPALSSAKSITAFSLDGVAGTINETTKTIAIGVPFGTDVTIMVATFTTTGASVMVDSTAQVNGTTANNFTNPVTYTVIADDNSTQNYTVTVTVSLNPSIILFDDFLGTIVNASNWHIPTWVSPTDGTYVGQTQFRCSQNASLPATSNSNAIIALDTYNPTGASFYGTDLISNQLFTLAQGLTITVRAKMDASIPAGIVGGIFLYAPPASASDTLHDEIDFELLSSDPYNVHINIYGNEPLGADIQPFMLMLPVRSRIITRTKSSGCLTKYHGILMTISSEQSQHSRQYQQDLCMFTLIYGCLAAILLMRIIQVCIIQVRIALIRHFP